MSTAAVDYLIEPLEVERFTQALARAEARIADGSGAALDAPLKALLTSFKS